MNAGYISTCIDHSEYLRTAKRVSPWTQVVGLQIENCAQDFMHLCYLGIGPGHVASCLKMLKVLGYSYEEGESDDVFLRQVTLDMRRTCKAYGHFGLIIFQKNFSF